MKNQIIKNLNFELKCKQDKLDSLIRINYQTNIIGYDTCPI